MRIALVTTPVGSGPVSGVAGATRALLPHLRRHAEVELFVEPGRGGADILGEAHRSLAELAPREFDQILYPLGNERPCGFMLPAIRALGGTVALFEWELGEAARGAYASLERGGWRGLGRALAEGGLEQARAWRHQHRALGRAAGVPQAQGPALNRSAVRFADAFVVHFEGLRGRILAERNEHTPIALVPLGPLAAEPPRWDRVAQAYVEALELFPGPRSARRSLVALAFRMRSAARQARAEASAEAPAGDPAKDPAMDRSKPGTR